MIRSIRIRGLAAHEDTTIDLDAMGRNELVGPSMAGKSTALLAVTFCLWGTDLAGKPLDLRAIRDGASGASVEITLGSGTVLARTQKRGKEGTRGGMSRTIVKNGTEKSYRTEALFAAQIGALGKHADECRIAMVPMAWAVLTGKPGDGRELRNLIAGLNPAGDIREIVAGLMLEQDDHALYDSDPVTPKESEERRREANRYLDRCTGDTERLEALVAAAESDPAPEVSETDATEDKATAERWQAYVEWFRVVDAWNVLEKQLSRQALDFEAWKQREQDLGKRPAGPGGIKTARNDEECAVAGLDGHRAELRHLGAQQSGSKQLIKTLLEDPKVPNTLTFAVGEQRRRVKTAEDAVEMGGDVCPTCHRDGWEEQSTAHAAALDRAVTQLADYEETVTDWMRAAKSKRAEDLTDERRKLNSIIAHIEAEEHDIGKAEAAVEAARTSLASAIAANAGAADWDRAIAALGDRPVVPHASAVKPRQPEGAPVTEEERASAIERLEQHARQLGAQRQRGQDVGQLRTTLITSQAALDTARKEAARLDALVAAVRAAPTIAAREQVDALGDLGPVDLELGDAGGCVVLVDGRPWDLATSAGRLVQADAYLRAGLRRALGVRWLPIWVDQAQDCGGIDPAPIDDPVVLLRTVQDGGLEVTT